MSETDLSKKYRQAEIDAAPLVEARSLVQGHVYDVGYDCIVAQYPLRDNLVNLPKCFITVMGVHETHAHLLASLPGGSVHFSVFPDQKLPIKPKKI